MELSIEEHTLIATYRSLDEIAKKELLRHASLQSKSEAGSSSHFSQTGQCKLERCEERPEIAAEPIFTE